MIDRTLVAALVAVLAILVGGYVLLTNSGESGIQYGVFIAGPMVSLIVGTLLAQRTSRVQATVEQVKHQTNSLLTAHLDDITGQLDAATADRAAIAATGGQPQTTVEQNIPPVHP